MYLASAKTSLLTGTQSRQSGRQEVYAASALDYNSVWTVVFHDPRMVLEMTGEPVPANAAVCLKHCASGILMNCDATLVRNYFGGEYEVCCNNSTSKDLKQILYAEQVGKVGDTVKFVSTPNVFFIVNK